VASGFGSFQVNARCGNSSPDYHLVSETYHWLSPLVNEGVKGLGVS